MAPLCAPIQCRSISIKGNAVQCWIDLWCSEVKRTSWQKKGRVLLLKIMPLFCYFRRITIGSSPFWEWSKSQQALAEALRPILTKIVQKLSLISFKNVTIVTILKRHLLLPNLSVFYVYKNAISFPSVDLIWPSTLFQLGFVTWYTVTVIKVIPALVGIGLKLPMDSLVPSKITKLFAMW